MSILTDCGFHCQYSLMLKSNNSDEPNTRSWRGNPMSLTDIDWVSQNQKKMVVCLIHRTLCVPEFCSFFFFFLHLGFWTWIHVIIHYNTSLLQGADGGFGCLAKTMNWVLVMYCCLIQSAVRLQSEAGALRRDHVKVRYGDYSGRITRNKTGIKNERKQWNLKLFLLSVIFLQFFSNQNCNNISETNMYVRVSRPT